VIVLDTNVVSELMRPEPHPKVFAWVAGQPRDALYTTSITHAEILYGIQAMPAGKRRDALTAVAEGIFGEEFAGRVLAFQGAAAAHFAAIVTSRRQAGSPIAGFHALIAATALAAAAKVATRDVSGFAGCGLTIVNPWDAL
jgi:predicted nucleic acid-binding protein